MEIVIKVELRNDCDKDEALTVGEALKDAIYMEEPVMVIDVTYEITEDLKND